MVPKSASKTLPSTWSDPSVNISLDNLVPGMQPSKPQQPSLNTMMQQQSEFLLMLCLSCFLWVFSKLSLRWSILLITVFLCSATIVFLNYCNAADTSGIIWTEVDKIDKTGNCISLQ